MRRLILCAMVVLVGGVSYAQEEPGPNFEHLKCFRPLIGTWRYEGPLLEDVPDVAKKGTDFVFQFSWRWILNKSAVEETAFASFSNGKKDAWKGLIGWNAAEKKIVYGGFISTGAFEAGSVTPDQAARTMTWTGRGVDGEGKETSFKGVITKTGKDTFTWKILERTGGDIEGPSPVYTLKRVPRSKQPKRLQQAK